MRTGVDTAHSEVLTCWKDIAIYMGKGVRTVQRWEKERNLPVYRPLGVSHKSAVIAHPDELDAWVLGQWAQRRRRNPAMVPLEVFSQSRLALQAQIRTSHSLRDANLVLVRDISSVLKTLIQSCNELIKQRKTLPVHEESFDAHFHAVTPDRPIDTAII